MQGLIEDNIGWIVQAGSMDFWHDNWMGSGALCRKVEIFYDHRVADFVFGGKWNVQMLSQVLRPERVQNVMNIKPPLLSGVDKMVWMLTTNGKFSVALAFSLVRKHSNTSFHVRGINRSR